MKTALSQKFRTVRILATLTLAAGWAALASAQDTATPAAATAPLPAGILPGSPLAQVVKLAKADVDEALIQTYVSNSTSTFNLDSDKIIYLKDVGVPSELVTQMILHDATVESQLPTVSAPPTTDPATPPASPNVIPPQPVLPPAASTAPEPPPIIPGAALPDDGSAPPDGPVTLNNFYDDLSPYGNWVVVDGFGRCWVPSVANYNLQWQPYGDHGRWLYTDSGWYWASDYAWGWAPFHYGRWVHNDHLGWCWSPDTTWGPSWVVWRYSDDYYGWAPLPPGAYYEDGVGLMYNGTLEAADFDFGLSPDCFLFVNAGNFYDPHPGRYRLSGTLATQAYHHSSPLNGLTHTHNGFANLGISPTHITQTTHAPIPVISLRPASGGKARVLPSDAAGPRPTSYAAHTPSGYLRNADGTTYVGATPPRYNNGQSVPAPRELPAAIYPPREEPRPQPTPVEAYRPPEPPREERPVIREERPPEAPRAPEPQPSHPAPAPPQKTQPH